MNVDVVGPVPVMSETVSSGLISTGAESSTGNGDGYYVPKVDFINLPDSLLPQMNIDVVAGLSKIKIADLTEVVSGAADHHGVKLPDVSAFVGDISSGLHEKQVDNAEAAEVAEPDEPPKAISVSDLDTVSVSRFEKQFESNASVRFGLGEVNATAKVFTLTQETYRAKKVHRHDLAESHFVGVSVRLVVHAAIFEGDASGGIPAIAVKVDAHQARANYRLDIEGYQLNPDVAKLIPTPGALSAERYVEVIGKVDELTRIVLSDDDHILPRLFLVESLQKLSLVDTERALSIAAVVRQIAKDNNRMSAFGSLTNVDRALIIDVYRVVAGIEGDIPTPSQVGTLDTACQLLRSWNID